MEKYRVQAEVTFSDFSSCQIGFDLLVCESICYPSVETHVLNRANHQEGGKTVLDYEITVDKIS